MAFSEYMNINGKHGHGTHSTKIGADKLAQNTPNAPKLICPSPKVWDFDEKRLHWAFIVSEPDKTQCGFIGFSWDVLGPIKKGVAFCIHNPNDTSQMP